MNIGQCVKVISNASYKHYRKIGHVAGYCKNPDMVYVSFEGEPKDVLFYKTSLEKVEEKIEARKESVMTNFEYYKEEILAITSRDEKFGLVNNKVQACYQTNCSECLFKDGDTGYCQKKLYNWLYEEHKEQPKLTKKERQFCELLETGWITRDKDGELHHHKHFPHKSQNLWCNKNYPRYYMNYYFLKFSFITWDDSEPWSIEDLLKLEVEE